MSVHKEFFWNDPQFKTRSNQYIDLAKPPPFESHESLYPVRKEAVRLFPHIEEEDRLETTIDTLFCPLVFDAEPFWASGVKNSFFNHSYEPFTVLFYVMREHPRQFQDMVDGLIISTEKEYQDFRDSFNKIWFRVTSGKGRGQKYGQCSVDEMIRMGSLFYILQKTCSQKGGLTLDKQRRFSNRWCGKKVKINLKRKQLEQYQAKLDNVYMSGMEWSNFFFRYAEETDENSLWFFHLPSFLYNDPKSEIEKEFTLDDLFDMFNKFPLISNRLGRVLLIIENHEEIEDIFKDFFNFSRYTSDNIFRNDSLYMDTNFTGRKHLKHIAITNYLPHRDYRFKRIS